MKLSTISTWNDHKKDVPDGAHAFLSASKYSWLNYSEEQLISAYRNHKAKERGTVLHAFACMCIKLHQKLPKSKKTLNMYVNDAIGYDLKPEQPLYFSKNCFGTADAISFRNNFLRIHDLKTGSTTASMHQLEIYSAYVCLEYGIDPLDIQIELRIYQNDDVQIYNPEPETIKEIMLKTIQFDKLLAKVEEDYNDI